MSYLQIISGIPNFSKAVISFWFRCPKETMAKAYDNSTSIDLLAFGGRQTNQRLVGTTLEKTMNVQYWKNSGPSTPYFSVSPVMQQFLGNDSILTEAAEPIKVPPCLFYLDTNGDVLIFHIDLQLSKSGTGAGIAFTSTIDATTTLNAVTPPNGIPTITDDYGTTLGYQPPPFHVDHQSTDVTEQILDASNDSFLIGGSMVGLEGSRSCLVTPDEWHHVLFSIDMGGKMQANGTLFSTIVTQGADPPYERVVDTPPAISSICKVWLAIDDENVFGQSLTGAFPEMGLDKNDLVSRQTLNAWHAGNTNNYTTHSFAQSITEGHSGFGFWEEAYKGNDILPSYSLSGARLETDGKPIGIPSTKEWGIDELPGSILRSEMAEFQMWTDVTLDTAVEINRRAFIDYERDGNGHPVRDNDGNFTLMPVKPEGQPATDDRPVQPAPAEKLLGKKPEILLHGSNNWIDGKNTGTTGFDYSTDPPTVKPIGQFNRTGGIKKYTPDPSLKQNPPPPGSSRKARPALTKKPADARL